jgi:hypothetical protein
MSAQKMSAAEWVRQEDARRRGIIQPSQSMQPMQRMQPMQPIQPMQPMQPMIMQPMQQMQPMQPMRPSSSLSSEIMRGMDESLRTQHEARRRNAFIARPASEEKPVRLSSRPSPEMEQIIATSRPGIYKADGNMYYKSSLGKIIYMPPQRKPSPDEKIYPQIPDGARIVNIFTHKFGTIERFRTITNNSTFYMVKYDDGSSDTMEPESSLLRH